MARKCSKRGCKGKHEGLGLCRKHYRQKRYQEGFDRTSKEYLKEYGRTRAGRYTSLKRAARVTKLPFDIDPLQHGLLLYHNCTYCDGALPPTGHGLDRIDPLKGYTLDNVVPCCTACNRIKNRYLTYEEMKAAMIAVLKVRRKNEA